MDVRITRLSDAASLPAYQTDGAAGFDLAASRAMTVQPGEVTLVPTGLIIEVPAGHFLGIFARSSTPLKRGLMVANGVGIVDSDYCGPTDEVKIEAEALRGHRIRDPVPGLVTGTLLAPRATFARLGPFADQRHAYALDWAVRLKQAGLAYEVLDEVLLVRRYHARNMSREGADSRDEVLARLKRNLDARRCG